MNLLIALQRWLRRKRRLLSRAALSRRLALQDRAADTAASTTVVARVSRGARLVLLRFGKEPTKNPSEHHSRNETSKHNESRKSNIHYEFLVTWFFLSLPRLLQTFWERVTK